MLKIRLVGLVIFISSCDSAPNKINQQKYLNYRNKFDVQFTTQFPTEIGSNRYSIYCYENKTKNKVGLLLYEADIPKQDIYLIKDELDKSKIAVYSSMDTCLLIVNRFETKQTSENRDMPIISDSSKLNRVCYDKLFPIPNFFETPSANLNNESRLQEGFLIYVLQADSNKYLSNFIMKPFNQVPTKWKNGYSKGVAINVQKKEVIYWSIAW